MHRSLRHLLRSGSGHSTTPATTRFAAVAATALLGATTVGCGVVGQVRNVVDSANILSNFADRLGRSAELTFTAKYKISDGGTVTVVQQPPKAAFIGAKGRYIFTPDHMLLCEDNTCTRSPNAAADAAATGVPAVVTGPGFVTPELALGVVAAAALVPGAHVNSVEKEIAGQKALCANATGLEAAASPGETDAPRDFSVCVTEAGVLASFTGTLTSGEKAAIKLVSFTGKADPRAFQAPKGAEIRDADALPAN